jgi:hypothetical protein
MKHHTIQLVHLREPEEILYLTKNLTVTKNKTEAILFTNPANFLQTHTEILHTLIELSMSKLDNFNNLQELQHAIDHQLHYIPDKYIFTITNIENTDIINKAKSTIQSIFQFQNHNSKISSCHI